MDTKFSLPFKNNLKEIERLHTIVSEYCSKHNIDKTKEFNINLALEELLVNTISYGFDDNNQHEILVHFEINSRLFVATIEDDGIAFNPLTNDTPNLDLALEDKPIGGLGIHFVKTIMDDVSYERINNINTITIKLNL